MSMAKSRLFLSNGLPHRKVCIISAALNRSILRLPQTSVLRVYSGRWTRAVLFVYIWSITCYCSAGTWWRLRISVETSDHKMWSLVWSQLCDHTMWVWSQGSVWSLQDRVNHTAFQACISILGIVINLCSGAPEFCLTVVSETAEKCFLTGGSQAVNVITHKCDHKCDHLWSHDHICDHSSDSQHWVRGWKPILTYNYFNFCNTQMAIQNIFFL